MIEETKLMILKEMRLMMKEKEILIPMKKKKMMIQNRISSV